LIQYSKCSIISPMEEAPHQEHPLQQSLRLLIEEDGLRKGLAYGGERLDSMFGENENRAVPLVTECLSETDPDRIVSLLEQISLLILPRSSSPGVLESSDSLRNIHSILSQMADQLHASSAESRTDVVDRVRDFVARKHQLLVEYLENNL